MNLETYVLTLAEKQEVRAALDNGTLLTAIRKIMGAEEESWTIALRSEALGPEPRTALMVQYAARKSGAEAFERVIRRAVGG